MRIDAQIFLISLQALGSVQCMKLLIVLIIVLNAHLGFAKASDVCTWEGQGFVFSTNGYTWGGGEFENLQACTDVLRATLIFLDFGQKESTGKITFKDKFGNRSHCQVSALQFPFSEPSNDFLAMMEKAYHSQSSPAEIRPFINYLDQNLNLLCP